MEGITVKIEPGSSTLWSSSNEYVKAEEFSSLDPRVDITQKINFELTPIQAIIQVYK